MEISSWLNVQDFYHYVFILLVSYLIVVGFFRLIVYRIQKIKHLKIQKNVQGNFSIKNQIINSLFYILFSAMLLTVLKQLSIVGVFKFYLDIDQFGWVYAFFSVLIFIVGFDAYYYFSHRLLHTRLLYKYVHGVHHKVKSPSAETIFCLHPLEAVGFLSYQAIFLYFIPMHPLALIFCQRAIEYNNIMSHSGYEFYTSWFRRKAFIINTNSNHDEHHRLVNCNYGYFFTHWDFIFKTFRKSD